MLLYQVLFLLQYQLNVLVVLLRQLIYINLLLRGRATATPHEVVHSSAIRHWPTILTSLIQATYPSNCICGLAHLIHHPLDALLAPLAHLPHRLGLSLGLYHLGLAFGLGVVDCCPLVLPPPRRYLNTPLPRLGLQVNPISGQHQLLLQLLQLVMLQRILSGLFELLDPVGILKGV